MILINDMSIYLAQLTCEHYVQLTHFPVVDTWEYCPKHMDLFPVLTTTEEAPVES